MEQVSACGIALTESLDAPVLRVTVQVTATKALLIADSTDATGAPEIHMAELPRISPFNPRETASVPHLASELFWEQEKPIYSAMEWLDVSKQERFLLLLGAGVLVRYRFESGSWKMLDSTELPAANRRSRNSDGTFFYTPEGRLDLLVRGKLCEFSTNGGISFTCGGNHSFINATSLSSNCEDFRRNLISGNGDYTQPDRIILTHHADAEEGVVSDERYSASVDMPGPVLDISAAQDSKAAFAAVKNLSTGNYEVYRITAVCGN